MDLQKKPERKTITVFSLNGEEYMPVSTNETLPTVRKAGFNNDVYAPRCYYFDFVKSLMSDIKTVDKLHKNISDQRPVIFHMEKGEEGLNEKKQRYGGKMFCGNDWRCLVTDCEDAWVVFVTNYDS